MIRQSLLFLLLAGTAAPALAQSIDQRVDRVERELRAVQRKVFPGGAPAYSEPEIAAPAAAAPPPIDAASGSALNALTSRVDSLERSLEQLTGQVEQANHRLQIVSEQAAKDRAEFDGRLKTLEAAAAPPPATAPVVADDQPLSTPAPAPTRGKAGRGAPPKAFTIPPSAAAPTDDAAPAPSSSASAATSSGDPAEDAYMAAYKLWDAKDYAGAEAALKKVVAKYPRSRRASYAQNLLGRAYLDDGQPASAAEAFAANYQRDPKGERAPDSLYYLGQSLMQLKKPADACRVYDELDSAYGSTLSTSLKSREVTARREAKCAK